MSHKTDIQVLRRAFTEQWAGKDSNNQPVQVIHDNDTVIPEDGKPFVRFSVMPSTSERKSVVNNRTERTGRIWMQINVPASSGNMLAWQLADAAIGIFEFKDFRSGTRRIICQKSEATTVQNNTWFTVSTNVRYVSNSSE